MVAQTSIEAYRSLKGLGEKQRIVHEALGELGVASNQDVADALGWPINRVTGRMKELRDYGFVAVHGLKTNQYGNSVKTWCVVDPNDKKLIDITSDPADDIKPEKWVPSATPWMSDDE